MSFCGARENFTPCVYFSDRGSSLLLAESATGSARKRHHFDTYIILTAFLQLLFIIPQKPFCVNKNLAYNLKILLKKKYFCGNIKTLTKNKIEEVNYLGKRKIPDRYEQGINI